MLKKDNIFFGLFAGVVFPVLTWLIFTIWMPGRVILHKPVLPYFIALFINLIIIRFFHQKTAGKTVRGVMMATFVFVILIFLFKFKV